MGGDAAPPRARWRYASPCGWCRSTTETCSRDRSGAPDASPRALYRRLAAPVRDDLVHVHVELRAAARHPDVEWEHVVVPAFEDLVACGDDEPRLLVIQAAPCVVRERCRLLQHCIRSD